MRLEYGYSYICAVGFGTGTLTVTLNRLVGLTLTLIPKGRSYFFVCFLDCQLVFLHMHILSFIFTFCTIAKPLLLTLLHVRLLRAFFNKYSKILNIYT